MIDPSKLDELIDVLEDAYDKTTQADAIRKEVSTMLKDWAERSELSAKNVKAVFKNYTDYRNGKLKWGEDEADDFTDLLVLVMDKVTEGE